MHILVSLLITISVLVVPVILIARMLSNKKSIKNKRVTFMFFGGYIAILLISIVVYLFLPLQPIALNSVNGNMENPDQIFQDLLHGRVEKVDRDMIKDEWTIEYKQNELVIHQTEGPFEGTIIIDRKKEDDGVIEAAHYVSIIKGGMDVSNEIPPIRTSIVEDKLELIGNVATVELEYALSKKEFVINQFKGKSWFQQQSEFHRDVEVLYLRIPSDLMIINDQGLPIHYVGDE